MFYIIGLFVSTILIFSMFDFIFGTEMIDKKGVALMLLGIAIGIWLTPSKNDSISKTNKNGKTQHEKMQIKKER